MVSLLANSVIIGIIKAFDTPFHNINNAEQVRKYKYVSRNVHKNTVG